MSKKLKLEILKQENNYMKFLLTNTEPAMANALRRTILGEVPVMAIEDLVIYENTSPVFDEYLAHRLGLIPLTTDLKTYKDPASCCGGNCSSCSATLSIDESGPKMIYSSSIKTTDAKIKPVSGKIVIVELMAGQRLRVEAKAILGKGEDHAKWQAGNAAYKFLPTLKPIKLENQEQIAKDCPKKALEVKKGKLTLERPWDCSMCMKCKDKGAEITQDETSVVFRVETNGGLSAFDATKKAIDLLKEKNKLLSEEIKK
ncbi:DNA-directed RNA polymerase subunit D [archaeon]|nr:DNA-directed RNA polymerase subunit D [archaeon]